MHIRSLQNEQKFNYLDVNIKLTATDFKSFFRQRFAEKGIRTSDSRIGIYVHRPEEIKHGFFPSPLWLVKQMPFIGTTNNGTDYGL